MRPRGASCLAVVLLSGVATAGEAKFTAGPTAVRTGDQVRIEFAVDRETDVAVLIEGSQGETVRHRVAGVLGKSPPAPLKAISLWQSTEWDGRDDLGRPAREGPFRVKVGLGFRPTFDGLIGFRPEALGGLRALATGPSTSSTATAHRTPTMAPRPAPSSIVRGSIPIPPEHPKGILRGSSASTSATGSTCRSSTSSRPAR